MSITYEYSREYDPAAPVVEIGLSKSGTLQANLQVNESGDTGADASMLPIDLLQSAGGRYVEQHRMRGVTGQTMKVHLYLVAVHVSGETIHGIRAVAMPKGSESIIGRDVLNQLGLRLNGPALELTID
ncbi:MAG: retropepsin-like aspartic protease [Ardenticatenaceae bacterium]|nr:retropepsin-like aspartic protease [Ardenticatenaceae bacterium]